MVQPGLYGDKVRNYNSDLRLPLSRHKENNKKDNENLTKERTEFLSVDKRLVKLEPTSSY